MAAQPQASIPAGSWVLVTGVSGFIAAETAKAFLERGYKVRGTVRDVAKASFLTEEVFKEYADKGAFELVATPDFTAPDAYDEAIKGVSAIAHIASVTKFDNDPDNVIPPTVAGAVNVLDAALREPTGSIKQFVFTSSSAAVSMQAPGSKEHIGRDTWNETAMKVAYSGEPYDAARGLFVYFASKVAAEKAVWKWVEEKKPKFAVNSVLPFLVMGRMLSKKQRPSTNGWVQDLFRGDTSTLANLPTIIHVHIKDVALIHVAAALDPTVRNERIQAWGTTKSVNWNYALKLMREWYPERTFVEDFPGNPTMDLTTDLSLPADLLRKWGNQVGFRDFEESLRDTLADVDGSS